MHEWIFLHTDINIRLSYMVKEVIWSNNAKTIYRTMTEVKIKTKKIDK